MKWFKGGNKVWNCPNNPFKFDKPRCKFEYVVLFIGVFCPQLMMLIVEKDISVIFDFWFFNLWTLILAPYVIIRLWIIDEDFRNFIKSIKVSGKK